MTSRNKAAAGSTNTRTIRKRRRPRRTQPVPDDRGECPICYEKMICTGVEGGSNRRPVAGINCEHFVCNECFQTLEQSTKLCPMCRKPLVENPQPIRPAPEPAEGPLSSILMDVIMQHRRNGSAANVVAISHRAGMIDPATLMRELSAGHAREGLRFVIELE